MTAPRRAHRRAAAAVEFGVTLPFLCFVLLAAIEYGWVYTQHAWMTNALRDGTRYAITFDPTDEDVEEIAEDRVRSILEDGYGIDCDARCVIVADYDEDGYEGEYDTLKVTVTLDYTPIAQLVPTPTQLQTDITMLMTTVSSS